MAATFHTTSGELLKGRRIALVGRLAGMPRREVQQVIRAQGGTLLEQAGLEADLVVIGEYELPVGNEALEHALDDTLRAAADRGDVDVLSETQFWQRLGLVEGEQNIHRLYTPAMLARLLGVPISVVRRWHRRGLIKPAREVRRLAYFDFQEVATARRLAELLAAGVSPAAIEKKLAALGRFVPTVERPLAQLSVIVEGKQLLLRQGAGLIEPGGQLRFDWGHETPETVQAAPSREEILSFQAHALRDSPPATPEEMWKIAGELEDEGEIAAAADMYRAGMAAGGPSPEICFLLAELLYQLNDLGGARERYYMAIELDENYVEARANLGCVLAELGERELAEAAFQGALAYHGDYPDVHYHLARTLDDLGRASEATEHWQAFLRLAPDSPWADEARERLEMEEGAR